MEFSDFTDDRGKRVVFLNNCLLNQVSRAPGVAFRKAASTELIQVLLDNGVSIEQLPCLESIGIGGVSRRTFDRYLPLFSNSVKYGWFPLFKLFFRIWLIGFKGRCKKAAVQVVDRMEDILTEGYTLIGVVGMNDSPTCGVTKTLDLIEFIKLLATAEETGNSPKHIIQQTLEEGTSYFIGNIIEESNKRGLDIKVVGYEPWAESQKEEAERVAKLLDLQL